MSNYFILMAAGSGVRMDSELPKQFIDVKGLPIVIHTYNKIKDLENTQNSYLFFHLIISLSGKC